MSYTDEDFKKIELSAKLELDIIKLINESELNLKDSTVTLSKLLTKCIVSLDETE